MELAGNRPGEACGDQVAIWGHLGGDLGERGILGARERRCAFGRLGRGAESWGVGMRLEDLWGLEDTRGRLVGGGRRTSGGFGGAGVE